MTRIGSSQWIGLLLAGCLAASGCRSQPSFEDSLAHTRPFPASVTRIEIPVAEVSRFDELIGSEAPRELGDSDRLEYVDLALQDALHRALRHSKVMRDLGGTVLRSPESISTSFGPAVQETHPQAGVEAALSAFDAQFSGQVFAERNDRRYNNQFLGEGGLFEQDFVTMQAQLAKRAVTGSQFALRHLVNYDYNNTTGNEFDGAWDTILEGEFRHPLLQGGGVQFNRIAGPGGRPGVYNGVLIARLRTDISLTEFEMGIRDLLANVENAYWDLYFAYRDLDTKIRARDASQDTWRQVHALYTAGKRGGEAEKEAQAREQYFRFEEEVQNALMGRPVDGTRTQNGSSPGTFRGTPGVYANERRLRLLIGMPPQGEELLRPSDEPPVSPVNFEWTEIANEALFRREELRRQQWRIRSRELELIASKNFRMPNLDLVGRYRWRGFGHHLLDSSSGADFSNAYGNLTGGDFQEWQVGAEFSLPVGFRQAHAGVRNAELKLARERSLLVEQQRQVIHDLSGAVAERNRAYAVLQTAINRVDAARQQLQAILAAYQADDEKADFYVLLDAQRRYADAEVRYYQSRVEYALAVRNVYFERGALLEYCSVALSEGSWPDEAYWGAAARERRRGRPRALDYRLRPPPLVSTGHSVASQHSVPEDGGAADSELLPGPEGEPFGSDEGFSDDPFVPDSLPPPEPSLPSEEPGLGELQASPAGSEPLPTAWISDSWKPDASLDGHGGSVQPAGYDSPAWEWPNHASQVEPHSGRLPTVLD